MNLFIDTHLDDIIILLFNDNKIINKYRIKGEKENSKLIMPTIKNALGNESPDSIVVCNGPGSFTGVRLGVTIAKTMAYTLEIPIRVISSLECIALSVPSSERIVAFNDKNGYYVAIFDENMNLIGDYEYLSNSEFKEFSNKYKVYTDIKLNYLSITNFAMNKDALNPHKVNPVYIKKLDVEK